MKENSIDKNKKKDNNIKDDAQNNDNNERESQLNEVVGDSKEISKNGQDIDSNVNSEQGDDLKEDVEKVLNEKILSLEDQYKRLLAEFDNFRKRTEKERFSLIDIGASNIILKILPVVDNFERALENIPQDMKENSFVVGIDNIYKQVLKIFEDIGVKPIDSVGKKFDASLHNAVLMDEESDEEEGTITQEMQKGWTYNDKVIRHSMVKVKK